MTSPIPPESRWTGVARPFYWALLGGTVAAALVDLYPTESLLGLALTTTVVYVGFALIFSVAARPLKWQISLWGLVPLGLLALLPYSFIRGPVRVMRYLDAPTIEDIVRLLVAVLAVALSTILGRRLAAQKVAAASTTDTKEKEEFQREKLKKVKDAGLDEEKAAARLAEMIKYAVSRVDYYEDLRHRHMTIGLGLITGATAIGGFLLRLPNQVPTLTALLFGISALWLLGTGLWLIRYYNKTASPDYVYRSVADIRSWFYAYNLPRGSSRVRSSDRETAQQQLTTVQSNFNRFLDRWIEWAKDPSAFVAEDLEQVFILQFIQGFKNDAVKAMQKALVYGVRGFTATITLAIIYWLIAVLWG